MPLIYISIHSVFDFYDPSTTRSRSRVLFVFLCWYKTMDVKSKDQDKDNAFSNADANGEILHFKELHVVVKERSSSQ